MRANLHHSAITVTNLDRSIDFYSKAFGLEVLNRGHAAGEGVSAVLGVEGADIDFALLGARNAVVELIQYNTPVGKAYDRSNNDVGAAHLCFEVDDMNEAYERVTALGGRFNSPPADAPDEVPMTGTRFVYFQDPDGLTVELLQPGAHLCLSAFLDSA